MKINKLVWGILATIIIIWAGALLVIVLKKSAQQDQPGAVPVGSLTAVLPDVSSSNRGAVVPRAKQIIAGDRTRLPFDENFESYPDGTPLNTGTNGWHGSSGEIVVVSGSKLAPGRHMNIVKIPVDCTLSRRFADVLHTNIWIQMEILPCLYDGEHPPAVDEDTAAMFYLDSNGHFVVHNGPASPHAGHSANWVTLTNLSVMTNQGKWITIGIDEDFDMHLWHLYLNKTLVTNNIQFVSTNVTRFGGFDIYNGASTTYIANISVAASNRPVLTIAGSFAVSNKVYDATAAAVISANLLTLVGLPAGADVALQARAVFSDKNAGKNKHARLADLRLTGANAMHYTLSRAGLPAATGDIMQAEAISVAAVDEVKVYDGTTSAGGIPVITGGRLVGNDTADWRQSYVDPQAGTGKKLVPSGKVNDGNGGSNYAGVIFIPKPGGTILKKPLSAVLVPPIAKVYDGDTTAHLGVTNYALSGFVGSESCTLANFATKGAYATANAGTGIVVTAPLAVHNYTGGVHGFSINNYILPSGATGCVGVISKAPATVKLFNLAQKYTGVARTVTNTTVPAGLTVAITYDGSIWDPVNAGSYAVTGLVIEANYQGVSTGTLTITK